MAAHDNSQENTFELGVYSAQPNVSLKLKTKVVHSSVPDIQKIRIPVPPIEEQERIVKILDNFDKLVNDITEGLPAEIEMHHQRYEYYRNKLLNFKNYV